MNPLIPQKGLILDVIDEIEEVKTFVISVNNYKNALPGQFNMIGYPGVGEAPISLSYLVEDNKIYHTIRAVGRVTRFLERFKKGNPVFVRGPYGNGWPIEEMKGKNVLLIAGGLGIAPLRPVIQILEKKRTDYKDAFLIYGARNERTILYKEEILSYKKFMNLYLTIDEVLNKKGWEHKVGLVTDVIEDIDIELGDTIAMICGPEIMMRFVCRQLEFKGLKPSNIYVSIERRMRCGIGHCGHCQHYGLFVCKEGPVFNYRKVKGLPDGLL